MNPSSSKAPNMANMQKAWATRAEHAAYFWSLATKAGNCWLFPRTSSHGYGRFSFSGCRMQAHVYAKVISEGVPQPGSLCLHSCVGTRNCVNPAHLRWDNHAANMADVVRQKRSGVAKGSYAPRAKLSVVEAVAIWIEYSKYSGTASAIAKRLGKPIGVVRSVVFGQRYTDVTAELKRAYPAPASRLNNAPTGMDAPNSVNRVRDVEAVRCAYADGEAIHAIAAAKKMSPGNVSAIVKRSTWREIDETALLDCAPTKLLTRLVARKDVAEGIRKKIATGKSVEWCVNYFCLPPAWIAAASNDFADIKKTDVLSWVRNASELSDREIISIWRLVHQCQKTIAWAMQRFSVKETAVRGIVFGEVKPHLVKSLNLKPFDGGVVLGRVGVANAAAKLRIDDVQTIRRRVAAGEKDAKIAKDYPMSAAGIALVRRGQTYKDISWPPEIDRTSLNRVRILDDTTVVAIYKKAASVADTIGNIAKAYKTSSITVRGIRDKQKYRDALRRHGLLGDT